MFVDSAVNLPLLLCYRDCQIVEFWMIFFVSEPVVYYKNELKSIITQIPVAAKQWVLFFQQGGLP